MKKVMKKILLFLAIGALVASAAVFASPGDNNDPLVSLSYITDKLIPDIHSYIDAKVASVQSTSNGFKVVDVKKGQKVVCDAGCELILRMGTAKINASSSGGLSDVTSGLDIKQNGDMPSNHLLIVPLGDGRGVTMTSNGKIMIKGTYSIK